MRNEHTHTRLIVIFSLICLFFTIVWLVSLILSILTHGPFDSLDQVLNYVKKPDVLFYITYINAALVTLSAIMLFSAFYIHFRRNAPVWSVIGVMFVPIYGAMNIMVYLSQISILPRLIHQQSATDFDFITQLVIGQVVQQWPNSAVSIINNLGYAVLGVPSIIFGMLLIHSTLTVRVGGILLLLNGIACIVGFIGIVARSTWLNQGSLVGGVLFLLALIPISWGFIKNET